MTETANKNLVIITLASYRKNLINAIDTLKKLYPQFTFNPIVIESAPAKKNQDNSIYLTRDFGINANIKAGIDNIDTSAFDAAIVILSNDFNLNILKKLIDDFCENNNDIIFATYANIEKACVVLFDIKIIKILQQIPTKIVNIQLLANWLGFKQKYIKSDFHLKFIEKMKWRINQKIFTPTILPKFCFYSAVILFLTSLISLAINLIGFTSFWIIILLSIELFALALISEYIKRAYIQSANLPLYIISEKVNF